MHQHPSREISVESLVDDAIQQLRDNPPNFMSLNEGAGELEFARRFKDTYVRTVRDVIDLVPHPSAILEIGALMGIVSISLGKLGHDVHALDIPELFSDPHVQDYYGRYGIQAHGINLRHAHLPFEDNSFDLIIMCETLEHLNFNPIPVLIEISRILKRDGYFYLAMPNLTRLANRVKLLLGRQIYSPLDALFLQLSPKTNMIVGIHWREYTMNESKELLRRLGFSIEKAYFHSSRYATTDVFRMLLFTAVPQWRPTQVVIGKKERVPQIEVWRTEANS